MERANQITSIITLIISIALIWGASKMDYRVEYSPAAGFFPFWLGIALLLLSLALLFENTFKSRVKQEKRIFPEKKGRNRIFLYFVALILSMLLIQKFGFLITFSIFTAFTMIFIEGYTWRKGLMIAIIIVVIIYFFFNLAVGVPLPKGVMGI